MNNCEPECAKYDFGCGQYFCDHPCICEAIKEAYERGFKAGVETIGIVG